jgi:hypothetical protein
VLSVHFALAALRNDAFEVACGPGYAFFSSRLLITVSWSATGASDWSVGSAVSLLSRLPASSVGDRTHRHVDEPQTAHGPGRRFRERRHRRHHGIEQRERDGGAHATQERPARNGLLADNHRDVLI